jgi:hypothetical protein
MAKKKTTPALNRVGPVDTLRLGASVAQAKASTTPAQWKSIVSAAHKRGFTMESFLDASTPETLKARTQDYLKTQATKQTAAAYAPVYAELDSQKRRLDAWDQKRKDDNTAYSAWLATQNAKVSADSHATIEALNTSNQQARSTVTSAWDAVQQGTKDALAGAQQVTNPGDSKSLAQVGDARKASEGSADVTFSAAAEKLKNQTGNQGTNEQIINSSFLRSAEASRQGDTSKALNDLFDKRTTAKIGQAKDYLTSFTNLLGNEQSKAQAKADNDLAAKAYHLKEDQFKLDTTKVNHDIAVGTRATRDAKEERSIKRAQLALDKGKADLNSDGVVDQKDYELKQKITAQYSQKGKKGDKGATDGAKATSTNMLRTVSFVKSKILGYNQSKQYKGKERARLHQLGYDDLVIDVAQDLVNNKGKLSAHGVAKAKRLGILSPETLRGI